MINKIFDSTIFFKHPIIIVILTIVIILMIVLTLYFSFKNVKGAKK